jgi:hypothetical protein
MKRHLYTLINNSSRKWSFIYLVGISDFDNT